MPKFDINRIPHWVKEEIDGHIRHGWECGTSVNAILNNDLKNSFGLADEQTIEAMFHIVAYLYNHAPAGSWGSIDYVRGWQDHQGLEGLQA